MTVKLLEYQGKRLFAGAGITTPDGEVVTDADAAASVAGRLGGRVVVKSQVPAGKRGAQVTSRRMGQAGKPM